MASRPSSSGLGRPNTTLFIVARLPLSGSRAAPDVRRASVHQTGAKSSIRATWSRRPETTQLQPMDKDVLDYTAWRRGRGYDEPRRYGDRAETPTIRSHLRPSPIQLRRRQDDRDSRVLATGHAKRLAGIDARRTYNRREHPQGQHVGRCAECHMPRTAESKP